MLLLPFLAVDALGFWLLLGITGVISCILLDGDHPLGATLCMIGTFLALSILGNFNPFHLVQEYWLTALVAVPVYIVLGVVWGVIKWSFYVHKIKRTIENSDLSERFAEKERMEIQHLKESGNRLDEVRSSFKRVSINQRDNEWTETVHMEEAAVKKRWLAFLTERGYKIPLKVSEHKAKILGWMGLWPTSLAVTLLNDPLYRVFEFFYYSFGKHMQKISNNAFKEVLAPCKIDSNQV